MGKPYNEKSGKEWSSYLFCVKLNDKNWSERQVYGLEIREKFLEWVVAELK